MRASRTRNILEADAVTNAESNIEKAIMVRLLNSSGVCVVGMHENIQLRNLGGPAYSNRDVSNIAQNRLQVQCDDRQEVGLLHSVRWAAH